MKKYYDKYGTDYKSLLILILDKLHVDLRIRLRHDGFSQQNFFTTLIQMYLSNDERMLEVVDHMKRVMTSRSKQRKEITKKMIQKAKEIQTLFTLSEEVLEDLLDMIEQGHGKL